MTCNNELRSEMRGSVQKWRMHGKENKKSTAIPTLMEFLHKFGLA